jgi:hypothetical protein
VDVFLQGLAIGMLTHAQSALPTLPANGTDDRWTSVLIGPVSALFVSAATRRVVWVGVFVTFFPPRSETSPRFPSRRLVTLSRLTSHTHWLGAVGATEGRTAGRARVPPLPLSPDPPCIRHGLTTERGVVPDYCPQTGYPYRGYRFVGSGDTDNRQSHSCVPEIPVPGVFRRHSLGIASLWDENVSLATPYFPAHPRVQ